MEKRTFLAIILSILILTTYNSIFLRPSNQNTLETQIVEEERVTIKKDEITQKESIEKTQDLSFFVEEIKNINTPLLALEFSNRGGILNSVFLNNFNYSIPVSHLFSIQGYDHKPFLVQSKSQYKIVYFHQDENIKIRKIYELSKNTHEIIFSIEIVNLSEMSKVKDIKINLFELNTKEIAQDRNMGRERGLYEYSFKINNNIQRRGNAFKFSEKDNRIESGNLNWIGFRDRYFSAIIKPEFNTNSTAIQQLTENQIVFTLNILNKEIQPKATEKFTFSSYFGPQDIKYMEKYNKGYEEIVAFSRFGIMDFFSKAIITIMYFIYGIIPNWGVAIILVSIFVYLLMYPLTMKSMSSMRKMQLLQPEILKIKEKNKNNPQKTNQEVLELYKKQGVNPVGGCLPFLLQMPVFIGLYQALWRSVMFKGADFLWIKDLSEPDRLFILPFNLPIIGNEINILPILMIVIMFVQQKFSSKNMASSTPEQIMQQKMMTLIFPVMLGFIFYKFASGLTLYFTMFYMFSAASQWRMSKIKNV